MLSLFNLHGRQPTCARPKTCAPPRPGLHPPLNTLQKDMWVGLTPLRVLDLFLKHSKCGADGDLASQEELEALQVRTGNTPPGAPGQAPSLPPGLPTLLLRCASAPLICAGEGPDGGDLTAVPGGVAAAAPAPVQAHALAGISVGTLPCRRRRQAGAAAAGNPVGSLARSGAAAAACGALARTVSCPAGQAVDGGRRAGPGCRPQRERGALRQHAWERAPRPGAARPLRTSPSRRAHPAGPAACLAEQLPPCTGQSWQASGLRAHPVAKKKIETPCSPPRPGCGRRPVSGCAMRNTNNKNSTMQLFSTRSTASCLCREQRHVSGPLRAAARRTHYRARRRLSACAAWRRACSRWSAACRPTTPRRGHADTG